MQEWTWWVFGSRAVKDGRSMRFDTSEQLADSLRGLANAAMLSVAASADNDQHSIAMRCSARQ